MHNPPKFLLWLLDAFCPPSRQDLKGDFLELYEARVNGYGSTRLGRTQANRQFLWDTITILPLKFIITEKVKSKTQVIMLRTNLKIARRNLAKNKLYTLINVVGLSVSLAACLLITLFVRDELSFDKHFANSEHIYRISGHYDQGGDSRVVSAATSYMLKPLVASNLASSFEQITRVEITGDLVTVNGDQQYSEAEIINVDSTFFDVFAIPFVSGSPATALDDPSSVVLDLPTAEKYFGTENAVGKTIELRGKQFTISGVIEPIPDNTHFAGHLIFPIAGVKQWYPDWVINNFSGTSLYTYVKFNEKLSVPEFDGQLKQLMAANYPFGTPPDYFLQRLTDIHLKSRLQSEIRANGSETTVYIFSITAIVILALACINYINLTMAGALQRSKEVGMKKVLGSTARMQISQFQTESILVVLFSGLLAALLAFLFMPLFNELSGKALVFNPFIDIPIGLSILVVVLVIGFVAGSFPAMILLRMSTMGMLSGKVESKNGKSFLRSGLIVFQFAIAITLIASTMIVMDQMRFIRNKDLGIKPEEVVLIPLQTYEISQRYEVMRQRLLNNPGIVGVSASNDNGTTGVSNWREYKVAGAEEGVTCPTEIVAHDFFENMGAQIVEGRTFSRDFQSDYREAYVINEAAVKFFDLDSGVVGAQLQGLAFTGAVWTVLDARIIGVVKNFHMASLHSEVGPVVYSLSSEVTSPPNWMQVRVSNENMSEALESLEEVWVSIAPERPFQYQFMDDALQRQYQAEERFMSIFAAFSILSILLGGLGLFGLTAFMTKRRTKEIGIRKILGASSGKLISLLSIDFLRLVVLANLIGWPIAWYLMEGWLKNFAYQTTISVWVFLGTGLAAVLIAFGAILYHSLKASRVNPVNSLRYQ